MDTLKFENYYSEAVVSKVGTLILWVLEDQPLGYGEKIIESYIYIFLNLKMSRKLCFPNVLKSTFKALLTSTYRIALLPPLHLRHIRYTRCPREDWGWQWWAWPLWSHPFTCFQHVATNCSLHGCMDYNNQFSTN